ncbi:MAG TPA: hypothetical protein VHM23_01840 [Actinomycetota bacterium]|nr:hypothetical protein [Actinomycetota bacterium]
MAKAMARHAGCRSCSCRRPASSRSAELRHPAAGRARRRPRWPIRAGTGRFTPEVS